MSEYVALRRGLVASPTGSADADHRREIDDMIDLYSAARDRGERGSMQNPQDWIAAAIGGVVAVVLLLDTFGGYLFDLARCAHPRQGLRESP